MIIIKLQGGLGNQMFQYALGRSLAIKHQTKLILDYSFYKYQNKYQIAREGFTPREFELGIFNIEGTCENEHNFINYRKKKRLDKVKAMLGLQYKKAYTETSFCFNQEVEKLKPPVYLEGFWQCERYFSSVSAEIRKNFTFKFPMDHVSAKVVEEINNCSLSVSLHVRRGDYVNSAKTKDFHGICDLSFYIRAKELLEERLKGREIHYFVFSDDPAWVKENLSGYFSKITVVSHNTGKESWKDMYLMSLCKHNVIANSSFSWWGAWLNRNSDKLVIAPGKWFKNAPEFYDTSDLIPADWVQISNE